VIFKKIRKSFKYAYAGCKYFIQERNIKIHIAATILVILGGIFFNINYLEWIAIVISISLVISFEILNTVIEDLIDMLHPDKDHKAMIIKDLAAAAVFVSAIGSVIVGLMIFIPRILERLQ